MNQVEIDGKTYFMPSDWNELTKNQVLFVSLLFQGQLTMDEAGYLILGEGSRTNIPGVFAAGDCADSVYRQAITAAGMGCAAAIDAERWLAAL